MTTVVYANGVIASDSLMTIGGSPCSGHTKKIYENATTIVAFAGAVAQCLKIVSWVLEYGCDPEYKPDLEVFEEVMYDLIIIDKESETCWTYEGSTLEVIPMNPPVAIGSGSHAAMGAIRAMEILKHEVDAKLAVKAAMKCDVFTGGKVNSINLRPKPKKKKVKKA